MKARERHNPREGETVKTLLVQVSEMSAPDLKSAEAVADDVIVPLVGGGSSGGDGGDDGAAVGAVNANGRPERKISYVSRGSDGDRKFSRKTS